VTLPQRLPKWWRPIQEEFPDWRGWAGEDDRYYARLPGTKPLVVVNGATPEELRNEIIAKQQEREQEEGSTTGE
jgi:hypothetical protein